jgi:hypothetical protein
MRRPFINRFGGKMKYRITWLMMFLLFACAPLPQATPGPDSPVTGRPGDGSSTKEPNINPFAPRSGDEKLSRGEVYVKEASLVIRESYPPQISLSISGDLPTPCHELRVKINAPDQENKIMVEAYSIVDPNQVCIQVLESFQESIDLGTFPPGHYSLWVNGKLAGEFDS